MTKLFLAVGLVFAVGVTGCASGQKSKGSAPLPQQQGEAPPVSQHEAAAFREIQTLYGARNYDKALAKIDAFVETFPKSANISQAENMRGLIYLFGKKPAQASTAFSRAIETNSFIPALMPYLLYNLATAQFEEGRADDAHQTLDRFSPDTLNRENRLKAHVLRARVELKRGLPADAAREALEASRLFPTSDGSERSESRNTLNQVLEQSLAEIRDEDALNNLYRNYEDSPWADAVLFRLGSLELANPASAPAGEAHLRTLVSRFPKSAHYAEAAELLRARGTATGAQSVATTPTMGNIPVESDSVGVLLPMRGKFSKFGNRSLHAIELAFRIFNTNEPDSKIKLVIEDSGEDGDQAVKALDRLVLKHHVIAVVGPLLSKGIEKVTQRAGELGVPLLSLARSEGIPNDYVFQAGLTVRLQAQEMAKYAHDKLGISRFAMIYPRDKIGQQYSQDFWNSVDHAGGTVVGAESYAPGETDFRQPIDKLSGLYYTEARQRELEYLAHQREENKIRKRTRKTEKYFSLPPVVDYQAVFIPEEPKVAGQIIPTFAYRDVDKITFLGTSAWNSPEFPERAQSYAENSYFVDAYFPQSPTPAVKKFTDLFRATFNEEPTGMEALAYDAAGILEKSLGVGGSGLNRGALRDRLREINGFNGVTGRIAYKDGQFERNLKILTVKSGQIIEASRQ